MKPLPRVTDHCVLRYLERAKGFDMEAVRRHIAELCAQPVAAGAHCVKAEGVKFEIDCKTVITCTPGGSYVNPTKRAKFIARGMQRQVDRLPAHAGEGEV